MLCAAVALAAARSTSSVSERQASGREPSPTHMIFDPDLLTPAALNAKAPETFDVKFVTTKGEFTVHITRDWAPRGADRFYNLVKHHYFDGCAFFRVLTGFVAQFGVSGYPQVNAVWENATFKDDPVKRSNKRGTLTFATAGANTRTTQIFINYADRNGASLDGTGFSPFGEITSGMEVADQLYAGYGDMPSQGGHGPDPDKIAKQGTSYLTQNFPKIDSIKTARIVAVPAAAAPKTPGN